METQAKRQSERWVFYTVEIAPVETRGPFGPFSADGYAVAHRIASARAAHSGLTLDRVERLIDAEVVDKSAR